MLAVGVLLTGISGANATPRGQELSINGVEVTSESTLVGQGEMIPDCQGLTAEAREYAVANKIDICGLLEPDGAVGTMDVRNGTCGSSAIFAYQAAGYSTQMNYGFQSTVGNMGLRALEVIWDGTANDDYNLDFSIMNAATYNGSYTEYVGRGGAVVGLEGTATTIWGLVCYLTGPTDSINVT